LCYQLLLSSPTKVTQHSIAKWEKLSVTENLAGVAAQAIYGKDFELEAQGSSVMNIFNRASSQQNRYSFALFAADNSAPVARAMGLSFSDRSVVKGEKYLYMVYFANKENSLGDTAYAVASANDIVPLQKPNITEILGGDKNVTIEWRGPGGRLAYSSYMVQRSADNGKTFIALNTSPLVNTYQAESTNDANFYIDSISNNQRYIYRVQGINAFGERGPYSDTASVTGKESLKEIPHIVKHIATPTGVELEWEYSSKAEKQLKSFQILRSEDSNKGFVPVSEEFSGSTRTFLDPKPMNTAYYVVLARGLRGETVQSFPAIVQLIDSIPPAPPEGFSYEIDTTGKVIISWKANSETDIYGYRIYRANSPTEEFSQITVTPVRDSIFQDQIQLKTLTRKAYYRIMAIDQHQNYSAFSEIFEVKRPDIVPPVTPVIKSISSTPEGVWLEWIPSTSEDAVSQRILRKLSDEKDWITLIELKDSVSVFCDTTAMVEIIYQYALQAKDEAGLYSPFTQTFSAKKVIQSAPLILSATSNRIQTCINLNWNAIAGNGKYSLYRSEGNSPMLSYAYTSDIKFIDKKVKPGTSYKYLLKFVSDNTLIMSNEISVDY